MMSRRMAIRAVRSALFAPNPELGSPLSIPSGSGDLPARLHRAHPSHGAVVIIHGLTPKGQTDVRLASVANALAAVGITTLIPRIPSIADLRLSAESVASIEDVVRWFAHDQGRPVGVFSASFGAGLCLQVAARCRREVSSLCLIGPYVDAKRLLEFVLYSPEADPYGRLVAVWNLVQDDASLPPALRQAVEAALWDAAYSEETRLPERVAVLPGEQRTQLEALLGGPENVRPLVESRLDAWSETLSALDCQDALRQIRCPVTWLHGAADPVIEPAQSLWGHQALQARGVDSLRVVTRLLDHGSVVSSARGLASLPRMVQGIGQFLRGVTTP